MNKNDWIAASVKVFKHFQSNKAKKRYILINTSLRECSTKKKITINIKFESFLGNGRRSIFYSSFLSFFRFRILFCFKKAFVKNDKIF
jgi:hypothetical protein